MLGPQVRVNRKRVLDSAAKVMELYGAGRALLELEFFDEAGTGLGPTLEFYALLAQELQCKSLNMWRCEHVDGGNGGGEGGAVAVKPDSLDIIRQDLRPMSPKAPPLQVLCPAKQPLHSLNASCLWRNDTGTSGHILTSTRFDSSARTIECLVCEKARVSHPSSATAALPAMRARSLSGYSLLRRILSRRSTFAGHLQRRECCSTSAPRRWNDGVGVCRVR